MLDTNHPNLSPSVSDRNTYTLGEIGNQNIIVVCLPSGVCGTTSAAIVTAEIRSTFPAIELGLLVGVGGGVPSATHDIRLGDVVVSKPIAGTPGVIQYDFGKAGPGGRFQQTGVLHPPPQRILSILSRFEAEDMMGLNEPLVAVIKHVYQRNPEMENRFAHPGWETDRLYDAAYDHPTDQECDPQRRIIRVKRCPDSPRVHYRLVASGKAIVVIQHKAPGAWYEVSIIRSWCEEPGLDIIHLKHTAGVKAHPEDFGSCIQDHGWYFENTPNLSATKSNTSCTSRKILDNPVSGAWSSKRVAWSRSESGSGFVSLLQEGDRLLIWVRAQFPGWVNYVQEVEISLQSAVMRPSISKF